MEKLPIEGHIHFWRCYEDLIGQHTHAFLNIHYRHFRERRKEFRQEIAVLDFPVTDDDERYAGICRDALQDIDVCRQCAGRATEADDRETGARTRYGLSHVLPSFRSRQEEAGDETSRSVRRAT